MKSPLFHTFVYKSDDSYGFKKSFHLPDWDNAEIKLLLSKLSSIDWNKKTLEHPSTVKWIDIRVFPESWLVFKSLIQLFVIDDIDFSHESRVIVFTSKLSLEAV